MLVYGYDERYYAEAKLDLTIFRSNCMAPVVWIPNNQTSFAVWEAIPMIWKSKPFQVLISNPHFVIILYRRLTILQTKIFF